MAPTSPVRACATSLNTCSSCAAYPFTVDTRFGIRSARRCSCTSIWLRAAVVCSSIVWIELYPQPATASGRARTSHLRRRIVTLRLRDKENCMARDCTTKATSDGRPAVPRTARASPRPLESSRRASPSRSGIRSPAFRPDLRVVHPFAVHRHHHRDASLQRRIRLLPKLLVAELRESLLALHDLEQLRRRIRNLHRLSLIHISEPTRPY